MKLSFPFFTQVLSFFAFILFLIPSNSIAQESLIIDWETIHTNSNGAKLMELKSIKARNGLAYAGGLRSTVNGERMYVGAYQSDGTLLWDLNLDTGNEAVVEQVAMDDSGNIYAVGVESVNSDDAAPLHIARIDPNGNLIWQNTFDAEGGTDVELVWAELYDDKLLLVGTEEGENGYDIAWAANFDLDGELQWKTAFDSGGGTVFTDISVNSQGSVAACGWADYGYSNLVVAFDNEGNVVWSYPSELTGDNEQWLNDLSSDNEGNWIAVGSEETDGLFEYDGITLKLSPEGNELWSARFNNGYENYGSLVRVGSDGLIRSIINIEENFDYFVRTIAYDSEGNELWATNYDIDEDTDVVEAELNNNDELILGVRDLDFYGVAKLSASGAIEASVDYDESLANIFQDIAIDENNVYACAHMGTSSQSLFLAMDQENLSELSSTVTTGEAISDVFVGDMVNDGDNVWMANRTDVGDTIVQSITKLDYNGNILWTRDQTYAALSPTFEILEHDNSGNVLGFYENLISGGVVNLGLVKYDADGNELFTNHYDSSAVLHAGAIAIDSNDQIYLGGYSEGSKLMFLSKLDSDGNEIWTSHFESPSTTFPYAIPLIMKYTDQDKIAIAAVYKNADNVNNLHLFQYDSNGNLEWDLEVDPQSGNLVSAAGLEVDSSGNITFFGSSGAGTYVVASYDVSGNQNWIESGLLLSGHAPRSMTTDNSGNAYLCFSTPSSATFQKRDSSGDIIANSTQTVEGNGSFLFPWECAFVDNRLVILGEHLTPSGTFPLEMLLDDQLNLISARADLENQGFLRGFDVDDEGHIHATYLQGSNTAASAYRVGIIREYSIGIVGIDEQEKETTLLIYPNPAQEQLNLISMAELSEDCRIEILDQNGRLIHSYSQVGHQPGGSTLSLSLPSHLSTGIYLLRIHDDKGIYTDRFVKK